MTALFIITSASLSPSTTENTTQSLSICIICGLKMLWIKKPVHCAAEEGDSSMNQLITHMPTPDKEG